MMNEDWRPGPPAHFGSAPYLTIVDTESGELEVVRNRGADRHQHGQCHHLPLIKPRRVDAVVCRGMGRRAFAALDKLGTSVLITGKETVSEITAEARAGHLRQLTLDDACGGHHAGEPRGRHGPPPCGKDPG